MSFLASAYVRPALSPHDIVALAKQTVRDAKSGNPRTLSLHQVTMFQTTFTASSWPTKKRRDLGLSQVGAYNPRPSIVFLIVSADGRSVWSAVVVELRRAPSAASNWVVSVVTGGQMEIDPRSPLAHLSRQEAVEVVRMDALADVYREESRMRGRPYHPNPRYYRRLASHR
jgi:hypothetical protein